MKRCQRVEPRAKLIPRGDAEIGLKEGAQIRRVRGDRHAALAITRHPAPAIMSDPDGDRLAAKQERAAIGPRRNRPGFGHARPFAGYPERMLFKEPGRFRP